MAFQLNLTDGDWWIKPIRQWTYNMHLTMLPGSWDAHKPKDAAAFAPLGRTNRVAVSDGTKGREKSFQFECLTVANYNALLAIYDLDEVVFIQSPTGSGYYYLLDWSDNRGTIANGYAVVVLKAVEVDMPPLTVVA